MVEEFEKDENIEYTLENRDYGLVQKELDEITMFGPSPLGYPLMRPQYYDDILREKNRIPWDWN